MPAVREKMSATPYPTALVSLLKFSKSKEYERERKQDAQKKLSSKQSSLSQAKLLMEEVSSEITVLKNEIYEKYDELNGKPYFRNSAWVKGGKLTVESKK